MENHKRKYFMRLALQQAQTIIGNTSTNPAVGCVIVKDGCVVSAASTNINGRPHAEYKALNNIRNSVKKKSNLFVTLEPCSHYGKTQPCVNKIIKGKIKKVFFSINDPDIRSYKKSINILKRRSIFTFKGIESRRIRNFYQSYIKYKKGKLPFVSSKLAISKDFYTKNIYKKWITNFYSRSRVHLLRSKHDCILSSVKTILNDNPLLDCRINGLENKSPTKVILDKNLRIPINSRVIKNAKKQKTIIFYNKPNYKKIQLLKKLKVKLVWVSLNKDNYLNLKEILILLNKNGYSRVFVESGLKLTQAFLRNNLVDDFYLFISNNKIKRNGNLSFKKAFNLFLKKKKQEAPNVNLFGDKMILYKIK